MTYWPNPNLDEDGLAPDPRQLAALVPRNPSGTGHTDTGVCAHCIRQETLNDHAARQSRRRRQKGHTPHDQH